MTRAAVRSGVHAALLEVELALEVAEHLFGDLAFCPEAKERLALGVEDRAADLAMLDELAIFAVRDVTVPLVIRVLGAMSVGLA
jgi:hypothetical protein